MLTILVCDIAVECNLFYRFNELLVLTFLCDNNLAVFNLNLQTACCKCTAEEYLGVHCVMLMKPPQPAILGPNLETLMEP